jgi:hypothetical protein
MPLPTPMLVVELLLPPPTMLVEKLFIRCLFEMTDDGEGVSNNDGPKLIPSNPPFVLVSIIST